MPPLSRLGKQLQEILASLDGIGVSNALIGGLALAPHKVIRATQYIDLLAEAEAEPRSTPFGALRVVSLEGLIAFKLQGLVNDPRRTQDLEDIRALLRANRDDVNLVELREHFRLFEREALLDELLDALA